VSLHRLDTVLLYTVTCFLLSFRNLVVNPVHFRLTKNIKKGNQEMI